MRNITEFVKEQIKQAQTAETEAEALISAGIAESKFDAEEIIEALKPIIDDFGSDARRFTEQTEIYLHDYKEYEEAYMQQINNCHTSEYARGFEEVFYKIPEDEQRRYLFWSHIAHSDYLFANNTKKVLSQKAEYKHYDRCLFWIVEIVD